MYAEGTGRQADLGTFLRSRRARLRPEEVGFASGGGHRRVPGLRREELAHLAGVSVDYYMRLEQGRCPGVSDAVLNAVAEALRLDEAERDHLRRLARPDRAGHAASAPASDVRPGVWQLLDWIHAPALAMGPRMDVLAWNRPACALITDFEKLPPRDRNLGRLHLIHPEIGARYPDRDMIARESVAHLRAATGRFPDDPELHLLIDELFEGSEEFRRHWSAHEVHSKSHGTKELKHPLIGPLTLAYEITNFPDDRDLSLVVYTARQDTAEGRALRTLTESPNAADTTAPN